MTKEKQFIPGVPTEDFTPEQLKAENAKLLQQKLDIIKQLNEIHYPLNATIFAQGQPWTIRNKSFWEAMQKRDDDVMEFMEKYLTEKK